MRTGRYNCVQVRRHPWRFLAGVLSFALVACTISASPVLAKFPGKVHCYRGVCHRVMTIDETERLIGNTRTVITTFYDDPRVDRFNRGQYTSSGERFDASNPSRAASSTFPDGTELLVWNPLNGRAGHVRINDFGPFHTNRTLDVTRVLAERLGIGRAGVVALRVTVIAAPHRDEPRYRRNRTFQEAKGYLGTYDKHQIAGLVSELVAEAQSVRSAWPGSSSQIANIPIPVQKKVVRSTSQVATAALAEGQLGGDAQLRRTPRDESGAHVEDPALITEPGVERMRERLAESAGQRLLPTSVTAALLPSPPPAATDALLQLPPTLASATQEASLVQGPAVAAWAAHGETTAGNISRSPAIPAMDWVGILVSAHRVDATAARSFVVGLTLLVMTALSLLLLSGGANHATLDTAPLLPTMKRVLRVDAGASFHLSKRAQSALQALLPSEAPNPLIEPRRIQADASFIGRELRLSGKLTTRSDVVVEGRIDGDCVCPRIVIKAGGNVTGDILADEVVVQGTVEGKIQAKIVRLESTARVMGEVNYRDLDVQSGAFLEARFRDESSLPLASIERRQSWENIARAAAST
jgi:rare lipoprotein A (peptidoglycan hydrolase)/cytoskeletal protein CcmA (bactofilin family)